MQVIFVVIKTRLILRPYRPRHYVTANLSCIVPARFISAIHMCTTFLIFVLGSNALKMQFGYCDV